MHLFKNKSTFLCTFLCPWVDQQHSKTVESNVAKIQFIPAFYICIFHDNLIKVFYSNPQKGEGGFNVDGYISTK